MAICKERKKCKKCETGVLDTRVHRGVLAKLFLFWIPLKRYRCNECWKKTYIIGSVWIQKKHNLVTA